MLRTSFVDLARGPLFLQVLFTCVYLPASLAKSLGEGADVVVDSNVSVIQARFAQMDAQVTALSDRLQELQLSVAQVNGLANMTGTGVAKSEQDLANISATISKNANIADTLRIKFFHDAILLRNATAGLKATQEAVLSLEKESLHVGSAVAGVGEKVGKLKDVMKYVLAGPYSIVNRTKRAEAILLNYSAEADAGNLDPIVAAKLRGSFLRATARTNQLAAEALKNRMESEG